MEQHSGAEPLMLDAPGDGVAGLERRCPGFMDRAQDLVSKSISPRFIAVLTEP